MEQNRAIFLDRDGTVIRAVSRPEIGKHATAWAPWYLNELNFEPHLGEALRILRGFGYLIIIITNQPDVAYGNIKKKRWRKIHQAVLDEIRPDDCYVCPHTRSAHCLCKKPKPGMLFEAASHWAINLRKSFMIGDTENDMIAGKHARCKTILLRRPYNRENREANWYADYVVNGLLEATAIV